MQKVILILAAALGANALQKPISQEVAEWAIREHFEQFIERFGRVYDSEEQKEEKFWTFLANMESNTKKNAALAADGKDQVHGITKFSDMTKEEFKLKMLNKVVMPEMANSSIPVAVPKKVATDSSFDWRDHGVVTDVKNQGYCGSCWAHSAVETLESAYAVAGNTLTSLSVQQVTSCDTTDSGCSGGWYYTAWEDYVEGNGGLNTEANYPYDSSTSGGTASTCDSSLESDVVSGTGVSGYSWATTPCTSYLGGCSSQDEDTLKSNLVSYGPVSIACDASEWSSYTSGVFSSSSCSSKLTKLDHAIQLVGYNTDADTPYWIVRNSWASDWGEDGYIYLEMDVNACGIADKAAMVTLA